MPRRRNDFLQEYAVLTIETAVQGTSAATGTIACAANTAAADGDTISIGDGFNPTVVYEYDKTANGVTAGRINWPVGTTAASLATSLAGLIAINQPGFQVTDDLAGNLALVHRWPGVGGNITIAKTGAAVTTVTGMSGGGSGALSATTTMRMPSVPRDFLVDSVQYSLPAGFTADANNYWTIALNNGATVLASWSTRATGSGGQGAITANTPVSLVMSTSAILTLLSGTAPAVVLTKTGTPNPLPGGHLDVHGHFVS